MQEEDCGLARQAGGAQAPCVSAPAGRRDGKFQQVEISGSKRSRSLQTDGRCKLKTILFETEGRERTDPRDPRSALQ